jgi:hypothetical protein
MGRKLTKVEALIVAGIENDEIGTPAAFAGRHGTIEQASDVSFLCGIDRDWFSATSRRDNRAYDRFDLCRRAAGNKDVVTLFGKAATGRCAQALLGANANNNSGGFAHRGDSQAAGANDRLGTYMHMQALVH